MTTDADARRERFEALYRAHHTRVLAYALRRGAPDAEELTAEVFVVAWRKLDRLPEPVLPWLYRTAHLCLGNAYRRRDTQRDLPRRLGRDRAVGPDAWPPAPDPASPVTDPQLHAALAALPPGDREVLALSAWEQLSGTELAAALGCRPGAARVRLHRARERLRARLETASGADRLTGAPR